MEGDGATAAAAAAAYLTGSRGLVSRPFLSMLAIGFCSKFGCGGGFIAGN